MRCSRTFITFNHNHLNILSHNPVIMQKIMLPCYQLYYKINRYSMKFKYLRDSQGAKYQSTKHVSFMNLESCRRMHRFIMRPKPYKASILLRAINISNAWTIYKYTRVYLRHDLSFLPEIVLIHDNSKGYDNSLIMEKVRQNFSNIIIISMNNRRELG